MVPETPQPTIAVASSTAPRALPTTAPSPLATAVPVPLPEETVATSAPALVTTSVGISSSSTVLAPGETLAPAAAGGSGVGGSSSPAAGGGGGGGGGASLSPTVVGVTLAPTGSRSAGVCGVLARLGLRLDERVLRVCVCMCVFFVCWVIRVVDMASELSSGVEVVEKCSLMV